MDPDQIFRALDTDSNGAVEKEELKGFRTLCAPQIPPRTAREKKISVSHIQAHPSACLTPSVLVPHIHRVPPPQMDFAKFKLQFGKRLQHVVDLKVQFANMDQDKDGSLSPREQSAITTLLQGGKEL